MPPDYRTIVSSKIADSQVSSFRSGQNAPTLIDDIRDGVEWALARGNGEQVSSKLGFFKTDESPGTGIPALIWSYEILDDGRCEIYEVNPAPVPEDQD